MRRRFAAGGITLGTNSTFKTWATWLSEDGATGGSLWTWSGTARNGEPFELIGINMDRYDDNGLVSYILTDWPYPSETVTAAIVTGLTPPDET